MRLNNSNYSDLSYNALSRPSTELFRYETCLRSTLEQLFQRRSRKADCRVTA